MRLDRSGNTVPMFPRAVHYVQRNAIREAVGQNVRLQSWYPDTVEVVSALTEKGLLHALQGDTEILPGLDVVLTGGPSLGHQIVLINDGGGTTLHAGNLFPTWHHLSPSCIPNYDLNPEDSLRLKKQYRERVITEQMRVIFPSGDLNATAGHQSVHAAYLEMRRDDQGEDRISIRSVNLTSA